MQRYCCRRSLATALVASCVLSVFLNVHAMEKGASISLKAKWRASPYLHEVAELVAEDNRDSIWQFLEASFSKEPPADGSSCWAHILGLATPLVDNAVTKVAPLMLASRKYSAKLAMYQQVFEESHPDAQGCCLVDVEGKVATSVEQLSDTLQRAAKKERSAEEQLPLYSFDHVYRAKVNRTGAPHAILYSPVGAACTKQLHYALKVAANAGHIVYTYRPVLPTTCEAQGPCTQLGSQGPLMLPGWGVEAVLKNTEYSAMDEKDKKAEAAKKQGKNKEESGSSGESLGEHKGFVFDTLVKRKPALAQELLTFRDHLMSVDEEDNVKVWDLKDVGLQATQRIMQAADPLSLFTELSQNFPSLVSSLSRQQGKLYCIAHNMCEITAVSLPSGRNGHMVNASLREAVAHNQQYISPGLNFMLLNGLTVDLNDFDYFAFLDRLKSELQLLELLSGLGLDQEDMKNLMQLRADDTSDSMDEARLDLGLSKPTGASKVFWINDLENDEQYLQFTSRISDVLNVFPNRLRPLAINAYLFPIVLDPVTGDGLMMTEMLYKVWQNLVPARIGITPKCPDVIKRVRARRHQPLALELKAPEWKYKSASERFALAFLTIDNAFGSYHAMLFWFQLSNKVLRAGTWGDLDQTFQQVFEQYWQQASVEPSKAPNSAQARRKQSKDAWHDLQHGYGWSDKVERQLEDISKWLDAKGLADFDNPTGWLNGMQVSFTAGADVMQLQQEFTYKMLMEQQRLQELVYYGRIEDGDDVPQKLLELSGSLLRWNPKLVAADSRKYVLLNSLVQDKEFRSQVPTLTSASTTHKGKGKDQIELHPVSHLVVCNLHSRWGRQLTAQALGYLSQRLPTSPESRVVLLFNPPHQDAVLPHAEPTMLEAVTHFALRQLPQFTDTDQSSYRARINSAAVLDFLSQLISDEALAVRLTRPMKNTQKDELQVVLEFARKAQLEDKFQQQLMKYLEVAPGPSGVPHWKPDKAMVDMRLAHARMARSALNLETGASSLISNGRVVVTYPPGADDMDRLQEIVAEDIDLLTSLASKYQANQAMAMQVREAYREGRVKDVPTLGKKNTRAVVDRLDDLVMAASAAIGQLGKAEGRAMSKQLTQVLAFMKGRTVEIAPPQGLEPSGLHVVCILNPLTRPAQRISQVLNMLRMSPLAPSITLILNPQRDLSELPLKSFYRYALPDMGSGDQSYTMQPAAPTALFSRLPRKRVLTLNMDVPESWLVEAVQSQHDLDNLRLADVADPVVYAELELSALMVTGSCIDVTAGGNRGTPPRGLQLRLGTPTKPHVVDTLVMSNLAYFQLKAAPGRWLLSLAPGRTRELYQLVSSTPLASYNLALGLRNMDGEEEKTSNELSIPVVVYSLAGKHMILRVKKRPGMEKEDVLKAAGEQSSEEDVWGSYYGQDEGPSDDYDDSDGKAAAKPKPGGDVINVFTVASGHMYERLQKIMILSVLNNTKSRVKFWFISNYMSPHHKQVIPAMADKFGFDWEFVTYKWPHWLHKQTDKQRIIWAYKILFLDVLFPLGVERIIFVDSDQVVRADLADLYHMNIKGRPYAYTPFCDNNKEMDEFRFWKGGFWANHLQGKPYHISALYMVDLKRFRALAAGDKLRVVYDQLSKDPNSLANLDQDLPNYAQHQIPIFSLPQEWLWCESWCGVQTKTKAKTIDLCNNPKTKEPKLSAARRIIAEWPELDRTQAEFTEQVDKELGFDSVSSAQEKAAVEAANLAEAVQQEPQQETETDSATDEADEGVSPAEEAGSGHDEL